VKSCWILLAGCLSASWLATASANATIITVTNTNDSGRGSLRQAIADANDGDTISAAGVFGSIELSSGELLVDKSVTINGPGAEKLSIENTGLSRVFEIASGETVTISGFAINSGQAVVGGGIYNAGILVIAGCSISGNEAGGVRENGLGGGIYNAGGAEIAIINSTISDNNVNGLSQQPDLGGGIFNENGAILTVINCVISGNVADQGGSIYNGGSMQITGTTFSDNFVGSAFSQQISLGGAIYNGGILHIASSTITRNAAIGTLQGGGLGGGIFNGGTLAIANGTISGNLAAGTGASSGAGGAIANGTGNVGIQNSTINGNMADGPGGSGFGGNVFMAEGALEIGNTILNTSFGANISNFGNNGTIISDGYNLSSDNGGGYLTAVGDQINADPRLGPLQDNGGLTLTHALLAESPAIDAGDPNFNPNNFQPPLICDQRGPGVDRVKNGRIDIGAFEVQTGPPPPSTTPPPPPARDPRKVALAKIRREMRFTRRTLHELNGTTSIPPSVFTWLNVRLRVLKARLAYPLDKALSRIDRRVLNRGPMTEASTRKLLARVDARLDALRSGR
jgi:hypothetical protein